jgi:hypothetical protein
VSDERLEGDHEVWAGLEDILISLLLSALLAEHEKKVQDEENGEKRTDSGLRCRPCDSADLQRRFDSTGD